VPSQQAAHNPLLQRTKRAVPPVPPQRRQQIGFRVHEKEYRLRRILGETQIVGVLLEVRITILDAKYSWLGFVVCAPLASRSGVKNLGRNPLNSFESAGYGPRSTFDPFKGNYPVTSRRTNGILSVVVDNEPQTNNTEGIALHDHGF
jgi:hypothetical protein